MNRSVRDKLQDARVTVMGLGRFGGGIGAARYLARHGARVTVTDLKDAGALADSVRALDGLGVTFHLGGHDAADFTGADLVVASPAVPRESPLIAAARAAGVPLQTEIGLFAARCSAPVVGITGSNGKTTTVSMTARILEATSHRTWTGGNIGGSLLDRLDDIAPSDIVVLELSSFQLEWLDEIGWSPRIAAILNLTPNHLDRHGTLNAYRAAKAAILAHQSPGDTAVLAADDTGSRGMADRVRGRLVWTGLDLEGDGITCAEGWIVARSGTTAERLFPLTEMPVPGRHNIRNALAAIACSRAAGAASAHIRKGLSAFRGVPHRLEFVGERDSVRFYNDSKATTPEATAVAVRAFEGSPVIPILGGYDKGVPFDAMARDIAPSVPWAALIGTTAPVIAAALASAGVPAETFPSLNTALDACIAHARAGDTVILTPGCASYDMFPNFEVRGDVFRELVRNRLASG